MTIERTYFQFGSKRVRRDSDGRSAVVVQRPATPVLTNGLPPTHTVVPTSTNSALHNIISLDALVPGGPASTQATVFKEVSLQPEARAAVGVSNHPSDSLVPDSSYQKAREYQLQLFKEATDHNVIAVLDTGSGKVRFPTHEKMVRWPLMKCNCRR